MKLDSFICDLYRRSRIYVHGLPCTYNNLTLALSHIIIHNHEKVRFINFPHTFFCFGETTLLVKNLTQTKSLVQ